mmetsp:Transcript_53264/g.115129  ORF Transcript_53264/g.115129 Transcript_53264/m.115129 type:complete len:192 (-) Transcript_53264:108-683(-)|eukprot:CAMPEP_0170607440 /NCGR_PEP_ID=MMETSP0224-20130122/21056_1 /TAXON_ID=285029 /ORGANISM="Togula jolla, Strain CCCM 725" /LENGTH=191 /DNA_ID=CAMNT_0010932607 /DNA_START=51 /DNA_END=626 /DNA_ORIENTATION=-
MAIDRRGSRGLLVCICLCIAGIFFPRILSTSFAAGARPRVALRSAPIESGKVNIGVELQDELPPPPAPVLECDESCMTAIFDCMESGCSVEALMDLDKNLAEDEAKVATSIKELEEYQKVAYSPENSGTLAWLKNFLGRSGSLRAQLEALKGVEDNSFVSQMIKAASVAFGGGRHGDYPKVGVSPYSSIPE